MKTLTTLVLILTVLPTVLWSGMLVAFAPYDDMIDNVNHRDTIDFIFPEYTSENQLDYIPDYTWHTVHLGITEGDYHDSADRGMVRMYKIMNDYLEFIEPDDRFVQMVADAIWEQVRSRSYEYTDAQIASAVLMFVRSAVTYTEDGVQYGFSDYIAYPRETLYSCRGDCEDMAILYVSIARAMGLDAVLVHFPSHVAVGVNLPGWGSLAEIGDYYLMECTAYYYQPLWINNKIVPEGEIIEQMDFNRYFGKVNNTWRVGIHKVFGWIDSRV